MRSFAWFRLTAPALRLVSIALLLFAHTPLQTEANQASSPVRRLEWRSVRGASGYLLEVRTHASQTALQELEVQQPFSELRLDPGLYQVRVAALNKFGRPGAYSRWYDLNLKENAAAPEPGWHWDSRALVPGLRPLQGDASWRGYAYIGSLLALAGYGWGQKLAGDALAAEAEGRLLLAGLAAQTGNPGMASLLYLERQDMRARYDAHQAEQRTAGWLAAGLYLWQLFDALYLMPGASAQQGTIQLGWQYDLTTPGKAYATRSWMDPAAGQEQLQIQWRTNF